MELKYKCTTLCKLKFPDTTNKKDLIKKLKKGYLPLEVAYDDIVKGVFDVEWEVINGSEEFISVDENSNISTIILFEDNIETLIIKADGVAEASVYWYIDDSSTVYLANLLVNPSYRNKGIGRQLQEIREQIGKDLNANTSCLWVKKETWMHEWYQRRGYSDLKDHKQKGFVWMTKPLL